MRKFLMTVVWITSIGSIIQLLVAASASWFILSGSHSFSDLSLDVFVTQYVPWLHWIKTVIVALFGALGTWLVSVPILIIAVLKLVGGTIIGLWAYSAAKKLPAESTSTV